MLTKVLVAAAMLGLSMQAQQPRDTTFDAPVATVAPSPSGRRSIPLPAGATVLSVDVSPEAPLAAVLVELRGGGEHVQLWRAGESALTPIWTAPVDFRAAAIAWQHDRTALFVLGNRAHGGGAILRLEAPAGRGSALPWRASQVYSGPRELEGLSVGPRPFDTGNGLHERIFFGERLANGGYRVLSVTDTGQRLYQPIGPAQTQIHFADQGSDGPGLVAANSRPGAFDPSGHRMLWQDGQGCYGWALYGDKDWDKLASVTGIRQCGGWLAPTPNGLGLFTWQAGKAGVRLYLEHPLRSLPQAQEVTFLLPPAPTPDGAGLIGVTGSPSSPHLDYLPISMPLADVANAWMFTTSAQETTLFQGEGGLLRPFSGPADSDQLYNLYDTELYSCGGYDTQTPTRPYLVTTDLIWEVYGAAFHGLFTISERKEAVPAFWRFVNDARAALHRGGSRDAAWAAVFDTMAELRAPGRHPSTEAARVLAASGVAVQPQFHRSLDYAPLRPRGFYTADPDLAAYFRAFRYFTAVAAVAPNLSSLTALTSAVQDEARAWIAAYGAFVAAPRQPLVWRGTDAAPAAYARHPEPTPSVFPAGWGFDNEVLDRSIFHSRWPAAEQITSPGGPRLLPSGLDLADAMGNALAAQLLSPTVSAYQNLGPALERLRGEAASALSGPHPNLYTQWLAALRTQWADPPPLPGSAPTQALWAHKRLQTGLASWATLRHTTVLVNDSSGAECGEGGFEPIVLTPPRGYVEPDPATFGAQARLFDGAAAWVASGRTLWGTGAVSGRDDETGPLRQGIEKRLREAAASAREFEAIARKEVRHEPLSAADYLAILYAGRAGEYNFLVFKSLANKNFALSTPDPLPKVADVAGNAQTGYWEAGVGPAMEWDQVVPYFGRREIVKGSVYSYCEVRSPQPMTDAQWRASDPARHLPGWIKAYMVPVRLACPAIAPY